MQDRKSAGQKEGTYFETDACCNGRKDVIHVVLAQKRCYDLQLPQGRPYNNLHKKLLPWFESQLTVQRSLFERPSRKRCSGQARASENGGLWTITLTHVLAHAHANSHPLTITHSNFQTYTGTHKCAHMHTNTSTHTHAHAYTALDHQFLPPVYKLSDHCTSLSQMSILAVSATTSASVLSMPYVTTGTAEAEALTSSAPGSSRFTIAAYAGWQEVKYRPCRFFPSAASQNSGRPSSGMYKCMIEAHEDFFLWSLELAATKREAIASAYTQS